ncbi:MAG: 3-hydroxyacyl-CoA dehydrogenase, partial [Nitrospiraceae bacterium]|nr:3-hydroxyacyl-CoA dehydrogenase [Nitrospiraceae bacterium]
AHIVGCGIPCLMLDIVGSGSPGLTPDIVPPSHADDDKQEKARRNSLAAASLKGLLKMKPSPVFKKSLIDLIEIGNFEDDFERIADCDWICEVVKEDLSIKKVVFEQVAKYRSPGSIVSTNTSGIPIASMVDVMDDDMRKHFIGTHFFNPPRYLKLLELIPGPDTLPEVIETMADFSENVIGKGVVYAKDTPNFIANRVLTYTMMYIMSEMMKDELTFEEVDALTGPAIGHASSATFRTGDLVGMDTFVHVIGNVYNGCPDDEQRDMLVPPEWLNQMLEKGYYGAKSGSGFYKATKERDEKGKRIILSLDPKTMEYVPQKKVRFECTGAARKAKTIEDKIKVMHMGEDKGSQFAWKVFANMAIYTANRIPEIADDLVNIDNALKWGFAWEKGVFETWDVLGFEYVCDRMEADGLTLPPIAVAMKAAGADAFYKDGQYFDLASGGYKDIPVAKNEIVLADVKQAKGVVKKNDDASLIDLGDGILNCEFHCKMNVVGAGLVEMINEGVALVNDGQFAGMVLGNQGKHFSAGANLMVILGFIMENDWDSVRKMITEFQAANMGMRFCKGPVVSTPHHFTFGGGIEMAQHADVAVIAAETYGGLVEAGVGVIPAGGGTKEMMRRALEYVPEGLPEGNPYPYLMRAFLSIATAKVSTSGAELADHGYFSERDPICVSWDQQIKRAKDVCLGMAVGGYKPPKPARLLVTGEPMRSAFRAGVYNMEQSGWASEHDVAIAMKTAHILTGGDNMPGTHITEQDALDLECEAFLSLCGTEKTQQRIQYMLQNNKPLRN